MFSGIGIPEIVLILAAILLLFGARRIPEIARGLGSGIRNFKGSLQEPEEPEEGGGRDGTGPGEERSDAHPPSS